MRRKSYYLLQFRLRFTFVRSAEEEGEYEEEVQEEEP
jgi:hypothetical protein